MPYYKNVGMSTARYMGVTIEPGCTEYLPAYIYTDTLLLLTDKPEEEEKKVTTTRRRRRQVNQPKEEAVEHVDLEPVTTVQEKPVENEKSVENEKPVEQSVSSDKEVVDDKVQSNVDSE